MKQIDAVKKNHHRQTNFDRNCSKILDILEEKAFFHFLWSMGLPIISL